MIFIVSKQLTKKNFDKIFNFLFEKYNLTNTLHILESLKLLGSIFSTKAGLSLSLSDLRTINKEKKIKSFLNVIEDLKFSEIKLHAYNSQKINDIWNDTNNLLKSYILSYLRTNDPNNQLLIMLESGARGSKDQVHQLVGMRSLMVDQSGNVVPFPIKNSFVDGLNVFEYILSSFGARKGIVDTALKTADSGYLTRRLIEAAYEIRIVSDQCLRKKTFSFIKSIKLNSKKFLVLKRSVLSCSFNVHVCQQCFGINYSNRCLVSLGENIGILSAHSMSEPSTQMTMRTFHTGGIFTRQRKLNVKSHVFGFFSNVKNGNELTIVDWKNKKKLVSKKHNYDIINLEVGEKPESILPVFIAIVYRKLFNINAINKNSKFFTEVLIGKKHILVNHENIITKNIDQQLLVSEQMFFVLQYFIEYFLYCFLLNNQVYFVG